jgi:hypothetical protein
MLHQNTDKYLYHLSHLYSKNLKPQRTLNEFMSSCLCATHLVHHILHFVTPTVYHEDIGDGDVHTVLAIHQFLLCPIYLFSSASCSLIPSICVCPWDESPSFTAIQNKRLNYSFYLSSLDAYWIFKKKYNVLVCTRMKQLSVYLKMSLDHLLGRLPW